jgi:hypothetical protein
MGFGPYPDVERFDAKQSPNGEISLTWDLSNGASTWARKNQAFWRTLRAKTLDMPGQNDTSAAYTIAEAFFRIAEWAINLDNINGSMTISYNKDSMFPYAVTRMSRDPYPTLESYYYKDGKIVNALLIRSQTSAGPYVGLRPDAPRDTVP